MSERTVFQKMIIYGVIISTLSMIAISIASADISYDAQGQAIGSEGDSLFSSSATMSGATTIGGVTYNANGQVAAEDTSFGDGTTTIGGVTYNANGQVVIPDDNTDSTSPFLSANTSAAQNTA